MSHNPAACCKSNKSSAKIRINIEKEWNGTIDFGGNTLILPPINKISAHNGTYFKKNAYLCAVVSQETTTSRRAIKLWPVWESGKFNVYGRKVWKLFHLQQHIYCSLRYGVGSHIYLQVWADFSFWRTRVFQNLQTKNVEKAHTLCTCM